MDDLDEFEDLDELFKELELEFEDFFNDDKEDSKDLKKEKDVKEEKIQKKEEDLKEVKEVKKAYVDYEDFFSKYDRYQMIINDGEEDLELGLEIVRYIAKEIDLNDERIKDNANNYIEFARDLLYKFSEKPYNDSRAMLYLAMALCMQTNLAYKASSLSLAKNVECACNWIDKIERKTDNRTIKAYALSLKAYAYMVFGDCFDLTVNERNKRAQKDLIYATKWDEDNYFAYYALALIYLDNKSQFYDLDMYKKYMNKVLEYENKTVKMDDYYKKEDKKRLMEKAKSRI